MTHGSSVKVQHANVKIFLILRFQKIERKFCMSSSNELLALLQIPFNPKTADSKILNATVIY